MGAVKDLKKSFPSVLDSAYAQYKRDLLRYRQVDQIMTRDVVTISPEASMREAAVVMGEKHIGSLIVKKYKTPVGIVTERDLLTKVLATGKDPKKEKVENAMSYPLITIGPAARIKEAAQMMYLKKGRLVVFDSGKLQGIVTASDLIRSLPEVPETQVQVDDYMTKIVVTADEKTPVAKVVKIMGEERIGSVLITHEEKPFGIFTERDLLSKFIAKDLSIDDVEVGGAASSPLITTPAGTSVHNVAVTMTMKHVRRMPVAASDETIVGVVTARDLVEAYAK
jgi:CBS domain-containing protein